MALGDGIRRNIAHVDPAERDLLRDAILEMHRRFYPGNREDTPPGGVSWWFKQDEIHQATHVVFAIDAHGVPWHTAQPTPSSGFPDWSQLGEATGAGPLVVGSNADGRLQVFAIDTAAGLAWQIAQTTPNGSFGGWSRIFDAVGLLGSVAVGSNADGRLQVFAVDAAAGLAWQTTQITPNGDFGGWSRIFDIAGLGSIAVGSNADGRLEVFAQVRY